MDPVTVHPTTLKKKPSKAVITLSILLALAVIAAILFAILWQDKSTQAAELRENQTTSTKEINDLKQQLEGATASEQPTDNLTGSMDPSIPVTNTDDASIRAVVVAYAHAAKGSETATFTVNSIKKDANFARATVSTVDGPGFFCITKKVDELWLVLYCGQANPMQSELDRWGIPDSMLG